MNSMIVVCLKLIRTRLFQDMPMFYFIEKEISDKFDHDCIQAFLYYFNNKNLIRFVNYIFNEWAKDRLDWNWSYGIEYV